MTSPSPPKEIKLEDFICTTLFKLKPATPEYIKCLAAVGVLSACKFDKISVGNVMKAGLKIYEGIKVLFDGIPEALKASLILSLSGAFVLDYLLLLILFWIVFGVMSTGNNPLISKGKAAILCLVTLILVLVVAVGKAILLYKSYDNAFSIISKKIQENMDKDPKFVDKLYCAVMAELGCPSQFVCPTPPKFELPEVPQDNPFQEESPSQVIPQIEVPEPDLIRRKIVRGSGNRRHGRW